MSKPCSDNKDAMLSNAAIRSLCRISISSIFLFKSLNRSGLSNKNKISETYEFILESRAFNLLIIKFKFSPLPAESHKTRLFLAAEIQGK